MRVYHVDPLRDPRCGEFLQRHSGASVFHTPEWLSALRQTYRYEPVVFTTCPPTAELSNGIGFCRVNSWLTGPRLVSLPFSDHCEPLVDSSEDLKKILYSLERDLEKENWRYIEIRPLNFDLRALEARTAFQTGKTFWFHKLDLQPSLEKLFRNFHKDSVQRKMRRAEREALTYEEGRSEALLKKFYHLLLLTRRRHQSPPHPLDWFRNLIACLGEQIKIGVAAKDGQPIASILTLSYKGSLAYKYRCSDARFHNLGGISFLLWKVIQEAKKQGLQEFDLGRSDFDHSGLIGFKNHWGATRSILTYVRYPARASQRVSEGYWMQVVKRVFAYTPDGFLIVAGKLLYKHIG